MYSLADIESLPKTRRSLLVASITTMIIASLHVSSNQLSLIGIQILLSQENMVSLGQAVTVYLLFVFCLQSIPEFVKSFGALWEFTIVLEEVSAWRGFSGDWGQYDDDGYPYSGDPSEDDATDIRMRFERKRTKKDRHINALLKGSMLLVHLSVFYLWPLVLAGLALFWPTAVQFLLK